MSLQGDDRSNFTKIKNFLITSLYILTHFIENGPKSYRDPGGASLRFCPIFGEEIHNAKRERKLNLSTKARQTLPLFSPPCCYSPTMQLVAMEAQYRFGSAVTFLVGRYLIYGASFLKFKMATSMAAPLGRKLFGRVLGANRYMFILI